MAKPLKKQIYQKWCQNCNDFQHSDFFLKSRHSKVLTYPELVEHEAPKHLAPFFVNQPIISSQLFSNAYKPVSIFFRSRQLTSGYSRNVNSLGKKEVCRISTAGNNGPVFPTGWYPRSFIHVGQLCAFLSKLTTNGD